MMGWIVVADPNHHNSVPTPKLTPLPQIVVFGMHSDHLNVPSR